MATPTSNSVPASDVGFPLDAHTASLIAGVKWGGAVGTGVTLTYSFPEGDDTAYDPDSYPPGNPFLNEWIFGDGWTPLNGTQQANFIDALNAWANVADIVFAPLPDNASEVGEIRVAFSELVDAEGAGAWAYLPDDFPYAGDIWLSHLDIPESLGEGSWQFNTIIHELGHALGLKHPFDTDGSEVVLSAEFDNLFYTVMTYTDDPSGNNFFIDRYPTTPMVIDIQSIQYLYGVNDTFHLGDDTYSYDGNGLYFETIWDAGGTDTIVHDGSNGTVIDLRPGAWSGLGLPIEFSHFNGSLAYTDPRTVWIAFGTDIENAIGGSGDDEIYGNDLDNALYGGDGYDLLNGGAGNDLLYGEAGDDLLAGGAGDDTLDGGDGTDTASYVDAAGGITVNLGISGGQDTGASGFDTLVDIENLVGTDFDDLLTGDSGDNLLTGGAGNDDLNGGAGNDVLAGGMGNGQIDGGTGIDTADYRDVSVDVQITLASGNAYLDSASGHHTLLDIENILGSAFDDLLIGNDLDNFIYGNAGGDDIVGGGGNDTLFGEAGNDSITPGAGNDLVNGGSGKDTVGFGDADSGVTVNLTLTGAQGTGSAGIDTLLGIEDIGGSPHGDVLYGSAGANSINGESGTDILHGLAGNDDLSGGDGQDEIYGGNGDDLLQGGNGNDVLWGGAGDDNLDGLVINGTTGTDILIGGSGNDYYTIQPGDTVIEAANDGHDTLHADFSVTLMDNIEDVYLTGLQSSVDTMTVTGNELDNFMFDSGMHSIFYGMGGRDFIFGQMGNDVLDGGAGNDILEGGDGGDELHGGDGNDYLNAGDGVDSLYGGAGNDRFQIDALDTVHEFADEGHDSVDVTGDFTLPDNFEGLSLGGTGDFHGIGNELANHIAGNGGDNELSGLGGDDEILGFAGDDVLYGGSGNDRLFGLDGNDTVVYEDGDIVGGDAGMDTLRVIDAALNLDFGYPTFYYISGFEVIDLVGTTQLVFTAAQLTEMNDETDTFRISGGNGDEVVAAGLWLDTGTVSIDGHDYQTFSSSGTTVQIQAGISIFLELDESDVDDPGDPDTLSVIADGSPGNDSLDGSPFTDQLRGLGGDDVLDGGAGNDFLKGNAGNDTLHGAAGDDDLRGGADNDVLGGGAGRDALRGGKGDDELAGGVGRDTLLGGDGADRLAGGAGADILSGGKGDDTFLFDIGLEGLKKDVIKDYGNGIDVLQLDIGIYTALEGSVGGILDQANFRANKSGVAKDADDFIIYNKITGELYYDADGNGDGAAIKIAVLEGAPALTEDDFIIVS